MKPGADLYMRTFMQRKDRDLVSKNKWRPMNNPKLSVERETEPWKQFSKSKFEKGKYLRYGKVSDVEHIVQSDKCQLPFVKEGQANHRNWGKRATLEDVITKNMKEELQQKAAEQKKASLTGPSVL